MTQSDTMTVFDRALVRRHRDRAAPTLAEFGFLFEEVAARLADRLLDVQPITWWPLSAPTLPRP